jgi:DNA primase
MVAASSCGLPAIATPGTTAWQPSWAQSLADKRVTIIMDCDAPGRQAAAAIAASLQATAQAVEIADLWPDRRDGYDLTDRILERKRAAHGHRLTSAAIALLLRPNPTHHPSTTRARARPTQEASR